jgi:HK97 family phage major capsid protein
MTNDYFNGQVDVTNDVLAVLERKLSGTRSSKAAAILAGAGGAPTDGYAGPGFLKAVADWRRGDAQAGDYVKAVLGTSDATGAAIIPNAFVAEVAAQAAATAPWRTIVNYVTGVRGPGVEIPYEVTGLTAALVQGAYGSNKEIRDWSFGTATATLYTIAQIADIGNQLLRQSQGAAEAVTRRRLGRSIGLAESAFIVNGTGSSQPLGILQALLAYGDVAAFKTTLSSEPRAATIGRAIGALGARGFTATATVLHPTDLAETMTEGLGTAYAGGWAIDPAGGPTGFRPSLWGVSVYPCADLPAGVGLVLDGSQMDVYLGAEMRIDVSDQAGARWDQNITGFRAEEEFAFNAEPYVRTGLVQKVLGL